MPDYDVTLKLRVSGPDPDAIVHRLHRMLATSLSEFTVTEIKTKLRPEPKDPAHRGALPYPADH